MTRVRADIAVAGALILSLVLAIPHVAFAECAWVLWIESEDYGLASGRSWDKKEWIVVAALKSAKECDEAYEEKMREVAQSFDSQSKKTRPDYRSEVKVEGNIASFSFTSPDSRHYRYTGLRLICLPDTIDPRGPKGGGR